MTAAPRRMIIRASALTLAMLILVAIFADLLASAAPLVMSHRGRIVMLPALTEPNAVTNRTASEIAAHLDATDWAIWAPIRTDGRTLSGAGPSSPPSSGHLLGTDVHGYDVLGQCLYGTRTALGLAIAVLVIALGVGVPLGALAGSGSRGFDFLLTRAIELTGLLPTVIALAVVQAAQLLPSTVGFVLVLGVHRAMCIARLLRGESLRLLSEPYVVAARALGARPSRVVWRHVVPHVVSPVLVSIALTVASVVALEAAYSFLGLGNATGLPSWGQMLSQAGAGAGATVLLPPALCVLVTTAGLLLLADALDDAGAPRRRAAATGLQQR
jgi:peptide/nickel transport system permease protein